MGKTTTKFTSNIGGLRDTCETQVSALGDLYGARKPLVEQASVQIGLMDAVAEKHMPGGRQTPGSEEKVEKDPVYIKAAAALDVINVKIMTADGKLRTARESLKTALKALKEENDKFEKYVITKKGKWFGTKNSVPAAEGCVKATKEYIDRCLLLLR